MLRLVILLTLVLASSTASAQSADAWLDQVLKLKQEGWGDRVNPALPDMERPIAPLMAFVSFSMPEDSLKAILEQVERTGGTTILRGLVNDSFKDTATMVAKFSSQGSPGFSVDPKLFAKYAINAVPSFVVPNGESFDKISGNISLAAALEAIIREGENNLVPVIALAQTVNEDTVPGYKGTSVPETGYSHGLMYDDAERRALFGTGQDAKAAQTITGGFSTRPEVVIDEREDWLSNAKKGEKKPEDFISIMEDHYGDCKDGTVTAGTPGKAYEYACSSPATKSRYACRDVLTPVCANVSQSCMKLVSTNTGIMAFKFDGFRYIEIGNKTRDYIADRGNPTRTHYYTAELIFEADRKDVHRFMLERLEYEDFVEVTFNGIPVFTDLDRAQYTKTKTCGGCHVINRPVSRDLNFDLRPYLITGLNVFRVRLTAVAHGNLWLKLDTDSKCCKSWSYPWQETCK